MDVMCARCAGLDVHQATVAGAVRIPGAGKGRRQVIQTVGTTSRGRDAGRPAPPAQIRTCALTHTAPTSDGWRQSAARDRGVERAGTASSGPASG